MGVGDHEAADRIVRMTRIVVFSGVDGSGKTTQIEMLERYLRSRGIKVKRVWARCGYTPLFSLLKSALRKIAYGRLPPPGLTREREVMLRKGWRRSLWLTVAIIDLMLYYSIWMRGLKWTGFVVLSDRYVLDTELDFRRNFPETDVSRWWLWRLLVFLSPRPQLRLLLIVPPGISAQRSTEKNEPFPDSMETLEWRYGRYREMAEQKGWCVLDGRDSAEQVHRKILKELGICG